MSCSVLAKLPIQVGGHGRPSNSYMYAPFISSSLPIYHFITLLAPTMPRCSGCSKNFQYLTVDHANSLSRCGRCLDRAAKQNEGWPQCRGCGATYEFLEPDSMCGECEDFGKCSQSSFSFLLLMPRHDLEATGSAVRQAMEQPPNPRADVLAPSLRIATPSNRNNEEVSCTNIVKLLS
jgi:hypothetical protein